MYYASTLLNHFLAGDPDYVTGTTRGQSGRVAGLVPEQVDSIVAGHARVWMVVALDHNADYQRARVREFDLRFGERKSIEIDNIDLLLYNLGPGLSGK